MSIGIFAPSSVVLNSVTNTQNRTNNLQHELTTNQNILDPAQQGVVTRLGSQVAGFTATHTNVSKYQNVLAVTQTGLSSISNILTQLQTIANSANDPTTGTDTATANQKTFSTLMKQIDALSKSSQIDGVSLMDGAAVDTKVQTGLTSTDQTTLTAVPSDTTALGLTGLDVSTATGAALAITALATALGKISSSQSSIAADISSMTNVDALNTTISQSLSSTITSIQQPNAQQLQQELAALNNQQNINYWILNQMNQAASAVLTLFR